MRIKSVFYVTLIMLIALLATTQTALAQIPCGPTIFPKATLFVNWPQFHYDLAHSGCNPYETILDSNTVGNLVLDWKYATGVIFESSPAVANGVVYVGSGPDHDLYALNARTGALLWTYTSGSNVSSFAGSGEWRGLRRLL